MYGGDEVDAVVLDVGGCISKAGYAGEDAPKAVFPSSCGVLNRESNSDAKKACTEETQTNGSGSSRDRTIYTGSQALGFRRAHMEVVPALQDGAYSEWDLVESLWQHAFSDRLRIRTQEHPVMLAEPTFSSQQTRERAVELMFERFSPPALFMAKNAVLSSFAIGRQTSLVVDMGYEGSKSVVRTPLAGKLLTECMLQSVQSKEVALQPFFALEKVETAPDQFQANPHNLPDTTESFRRYHVEQVAADIKESICRVSDTPFDAEANANIPTVDYELPDGTLVQVGPDRFSVPEVLFQPSVLKSFKAIQPVLPKGTEMNSLPASIVKSIEFCDVDARKDLYSGIVMTGGTSLFPQLRDRLEKELTDMTPQAAKVKVVLPANTIERRFSVWIGERSSPHAKSWFKNPTLGFRQFPAKANVAFQERVRRTWRQPDPSKSSLTALSKLLLSSSERDFHCISLGKIVQHCHTPRNMPRRLETPDSRASRSSASRNRLLAGPLADISDYLFEKSSIPLLLAALSSAALIGYHISLQAEPLRANNELPLLLYRSTYTADDVYQLFDVLGPAGRAEYQFLNVLATGVFPFLVAMTFAIALGLLYDRAGLGHEWNMFPFIVAFSATVESLGISWLLWSYPRVRGNVAGVLGLLSSMKLRFLWYTLLALGIGIILAAKCSLQESLKKRR